MGFSKMSVTIPNDIYEEIRMLASRKKLKLSHLVTEALYEKARKMKSEAFFKQINDVFSEPEVDEEQYLMAETIAENTDLKELPW